MSNTEASGTPGTGDGLVGSVLAGRYRILEKLGEGAMGAVYLGEHLKIGRRDAIKVLREALATDREAIARFTRGARNVSAINHTNVCTIYDYSDTDDGISFLAMEFVPGASLREVLEREGPLPVERAVHIARQTADALQAAHEAGIVHRDLKPANIMLMRDRDGRDEVRVVDFDIAKGTQDGEESEVTRLGFVVGTPEYMSPEQLMGERLDGRSDVYSLAIVLFRMLTGTLPFRADTAHEVMFQRLTGTPLRLDEALPGRSFPPRLQAALDRALQRKATDRPANAAEFGRELTAALAGVVETSPPRATPLSATGVLGAAEPAFREGAGELPATVVSPTPAAAAGSGVQDAPAERRSSAPRRPRQNQVFAVSAIFLVVALGGVGTWVVFGERAAAPGEGTGQGQVGGPTAIPDSLFSRSIDSTAVPGAALREAQERADAGTASDASLRSQAEVAARRPEIVSTRTPEPERSTPADPGDARVSTSSPSAVEASEVLARQFRRFSLTDLSREEILAVRDTAERLWTRTDLGPEQRARAAHIAADIWRRDRDDNRCLEWIEKALSMNPTSRSFQLIRQQCGGT